MTRKPGNVGYEHKISMPRTHLGTVKFLRDQGVLRGRIVIEDTGNDTITIECETPKDRAILVMARVADPF
jgi:hypothetical protein